MSDRWTDRLSEYLDGELSPAEHRELEAHLAGCAECAGIVADLREVVSRASMLEDRAPETDLWAGIEKRIRAEPPEIQVVSLFDARRPRRISFSIPQLLAAGIVLALASAGTVWLALSRGGVPGSAGSVAVAPVVVHPRTSAPAPVRDTAALAPEEAAGEEAPAARFVSGPASPRGGGAPRARGGAETRLAGFAEPQYEAAVADLQRILDEGRGKLDPRTVKALEESLRTIDGAIADARRALAADPANADLSNYLAGTMQRKLELLRQASEIVTAQT